MADLILLMKPSSQARLSRISENAIGYYIRIFMSLVMSEMGHVCL